MLEITKIIQNKHAHPVIAQMLHPDVRDDLPPSECALPPKQSYGRRIARSLQRNFTWDTHGWFALFFRPPPSWLPPGRSTRSMALQKH